ncbi:MAG: C1 family peptidase [Paludibacteraceae bacterium]|nr:C1 family peptidase [Paludibacteraceae bacterium]MEE3484695.1 C1 family peptidase [Bacteroidales bacterium]
MNKFRSKIFAFLLIPCITFTSCDDETIETVLNVVDEILNIFGFNMENEDVEDQETADDESDAVITDTKVSWEAKCPPIGNQGSYGTCVAWATAYGMKTTLNVIDGTWSSASSASHQCSPIDLWHLIPTSGKSTKCNGSNFEPALQAMIDNGVATMSEVPFTQNKMTCDNVTGKGSSNKLGQFRIVAYSAEMSNNGKAYGMNVTNIKYYLKEGPLVIGAQLGNRFMNWKGSNVITYDDKTYNGQHAYHAMTLVGYDDSKNAFRVRNSWGADDWGDNGSIWVDYDFFVKQFCFGVWSASNKAASTSSASLKSASAKDIKVAVLSDVAETSTLRTVTYTITNNSSSAISTDNYPISYILFKAKHFAERYIVMDKAESKTIKAGETVTLSHSYEIPAEASDGKYFLALIADPTNEIGDRNRDDNFFYVTSENGLPLLMLQNTLSGVPQNISEVRSLVCASNKNAYRNTEIEASLRKAKK